MRYAYKCVPAPRRAKKGKGHKNPAEALAAAFEAVMAEHAAAGWEYLRTDLAPMEARRGLFGGLIETHQGVMVFHRAAAPAPAAEPTLDLGRGAEPAEGAGRIPELGAARID
jgi:hypothetical protein